MEETRVNEAYKKSKTTIYLETLQTAFDSQEAINQYRLSAVVLDALNDTENAKEFPLEVDAAKAQLEKFNCANLKDYFMQYAEVIDPMFCTVGDAIVILDEPYDDVAFNVGSHFMFVHDETETVKVTPIAFNDIPQGAIAFRLTK
ncbi:hypothetical protein [Aeromonas veronii]|uniref:hypothetical protein n=1 Tax=Aeromonas veronii TaxID=654 RepID=UPI003670DB59